MATESELRQHRACFTGHRPHKLHQPESVVIAALEAKIREAIDDGFVTFISGMAWGVDIWAAEIVLRLKVHTAAASGRWCGAERPLCGLSNSRH